MLHLREHQIDALERVKQGFDAGHTRQLLYAPTGAGKTEMAISLMNDYAKGYQRSAMVMDRIVLVEQTSLRLGKYKIDHGVLQAGHWRYQPSQRIQICSIQTLARRGKMQTPELLFYDECFVAGTKISTPKGLVDIDKVRCGDMVYNHIGVGIVEAISIKPSNDLYRLEFDDGTITECTGSHPYFTERGWQKAGELEIGSYFFGVQGLRLLWERLEALGEEGRERQDDLKYAGTDMDQASYLLSLLCQEIKKPNEQLSVQIKNEGEAARNQAYAYQAWRERAIATFAAIGASSCFGGRLGIGVCSQNENTEREWLSTLLQVGLSKRQPNDRNRDRWRVTHDTRKERAGQKENRSTYFPRLVSISPIKREGVTPVFNLQVSGHPSYFANGSLVHNCHVNYKSVIDYIKDNPTIKVVGLSATPFTKGLSELYTNVVSAIPTENLVEKGFLCPLKVYIAKEIDMTGAKKIAGEWSAADVSDRGMKITGDIVAEWVKKTHEIFGAPRKTVVFCSGVEHGRDLAQQFKNAGYNFVSISYKEDDEFKRLTIEDFSKPDTQIHGLIATDILTKGFDVSDVMIGVSARPFSKSLSSHIQQLGRVLRSHEGKEFAVWLDHAGNYLRFRGEWDDIYSNGVTELKPSGEVAKKEPTEKEKKESTCPKCKALWIGGDICTACGYVRQRMSMVESVPGEMQELQAANKKLIIDNQSFYSQLIHFAQAKGYKSGWAYHKYREKFNVPPNGLSSTPEQPNNATLNWINSRTIAFAKAKARSA